MPESPERSRWPIYAGIVVVLIFIAAMGWQYSRAQNLEQELAVARTEATLGAAALEAQRGSYEVSRRLASDFYTQLQGTIDRTPSEIRPQLSSILSQRDAVITMLSRNDAQSANVLARMFTQYRTAIHGPEPTVTPPGATTESRSPDAGGT